MVSVDVDLRIYVPNAFSPNGDGLNDCFELKGTVYDVVETFDVAIFNRNGQVILKSTINNPACLWDGHNNDGTLVPAGSYIYRITGIDYKGQKHKWEGVLSVVL